MSERNTSIDIGRFLAAFLVVSLHTRLQVPYLGAIFGSLGKIAVPYFFMVSGYYLFSQDQLLVKHKAKKNIKKISIIIIQASIVYSCLRLVKHFYYHIDISSQRFVLWKFLLYNDFMFTEHLWYVFSIFYVFVIVWILSFFRLFKYLIYSVPFLLIIHFIATLLARSNMTFFAVDLNWLTAGLPFVVIGMVVRVYLEQGFVIEQKILRIIILFLFISVFIEHFAFREIIGRGPGVISVLFLSIACLIYCAYNYPIFSTRVSHLLSKLGRKHSLNIYLYHVLIREIITLNGAGKLLNNTITIFLVSLILSFLIEYCKELVLKRKANNLVKNI